MTRTQHRPATPAQAVIHHYRNTYRGVKYPMADKTRNAGLTSRAREGDRDARNELILANMGLVHVKVRQFLARYPWPAMDLEDLVQDGAGALGDCASGFDPDRGNGFGAYAGGAIWNRCREARRRSPSGCSRASSPATTTTARRGFALLLTSLRLLMRSGGVWDIWVSRYTSPNLPCRPRVTAISISGLRGMNKKAKPPDVRRGRRGRAGRRGGEPRGGRGGARGVREGRPEGAPCYADRARHGLGPGAPSPTRLREVGDAFGISKQRQPAARKVGARARALLMGRPLPAMHDRKALRGRVVRK